jgi:hypothetical protein
MGRWFRPWWWINGAAAIAFGLALVCCLSPGLQPLPTGTGFELLLSPLMGLLFLHLMGPLAILGVWGTGLGAVSGPLLCFVGASVFWLVALWGWLAGAARSLWRRWRARDRRPFLPLTVRRRSLVVPVLYGLLLLLWWSHGLLLVSAIVHREGLTQLAQTQTARPFDPNGAIFETVDQPVGLFRVAAVGQVAPGVVALVNHPGHGIWAYDGFVWVAPDAIAAFDPNAQSLGPGSNTGDQDAIALGNGWYAFQNWFD